jgi:ABC-type transport system involved in multi-copper enzyme maturation permease subunit
MTLATAVRPVSAGTGPAARVRFGRLLLAEWTKLRSVRSTIWSLLLLCVLTLGLTALYTALTVSQWDQAGAFHHAQTAADPTALIVGGGLALSQLTVCVLGVLVMASEYSTGSIRTSLLAVPTRTPMLLAKSVVFALLIFVVGEAVAFSSFFLGASILHAKAPVAIGDPGVARAVAGVGLYLSVLGLFALAIGALLRHTAAAVTAVIGLVLVLSPLAQLLPGNLGKHVDAYLPSEAGHLITQAHRASGDLLSPWQGFTVFCLWTAALLAAAAWSLNRRDA